MNKPRVFGVKSPWSGDENDPSGLSYEVWYFFYRATRRLKHLVGWHDWQAVWSDASRQTYYCYWCGKRSWSSK